MNFESRDFNFAPGEPTRIIAEVGVNHNGDPAEARRLVDIAIEAGADIIKFQSFISEKEISRFAEKAAYQHETSSAANQLELCKALELSPSDLRMLKDYCREKGAAFLCTAFEFDSVDLLADDLRVQSIKVPSGEITNLPLLEYIGSKRLSVLLSTGASTISETGLAIEALRRGGAENIALMHCVSNYPAPPEDVNLLAMRSLAAAFGLPVGYSDHTNGIEVPIAAAALGAAMIEKHFTRDRSAEGPDHRASLEPDELAAMVRGVALISAARGDGIKRAMPSEIDNVPLIRKSLVVNRALPAGTRLTREMLEIKRPATGIVPADIDKVVGRSLSRAMEDDEPVTWADLA